MSNAKIAALITDALVEGRLVHPGDPASDLPPRQIVLPIFQSDGQPKEVADLMATTAKFLGEAIVALIETEGETSMIPTAKLDEMRVATTPEKPGRRVVKVHCRCDADGSMPLAVLTVDSSDRVVIDGKQLLGALHQRSAEHPHGRIE
jgi:hypothetical protein